MLIRQSICIIIETPLINFSVSSGSFLSIHLSCSTNGGYPAYHNISIVKNGEPLASIIASELVHTIYDNQTTQKYGLYQCVVDALALKEILLEEKGTLK